MKTKKEIQAIHRYSITAPKNPGARWMTKIREGGQLKKVVATTERGLYKKLALFYYEQSRTMETLLDEWRERRISTNVDFRTIAINVNHWDKYYAGHDLVKKPLQDISVFDLEDFFHEQIKIHGLTVKSLNNMKIIAKDMLHMSKRKGYINENPFHDIEINKESCQPPSKANDVSRIYLPEERERFFRAIGEEMRENPSNTDCYAIMLLFKFGLRIGELTALRWGDIDRRADELQIRRMETVVEVDGKTYREVVPYTKKRSEYGFREMPLTGYEYGIFEAVKEVNRASGYKDGDYIFCDSDGRRKNREIDCKIRKLCKAAAIVPAKSAHDIRRTVATQMYQDGVPISEIQRFLGHSDEKTTWGYIVDFDGKARHRSLITNSLNIFSVPLCTQFAEKAKTPETA
jgi:integrase